MNNTKDPRKCWVFPRLRKHRFYLRCIRSVTRPFDAGKKVTVLILSQLGASCTVSRLNESARVVQ